jgi:hypothetical protein
MSSHTTQSRFDGVSSRTVFCLWTGDEMLSDNRLRAIWSIISNTGCPVAFINKQSLADWIVPEHPLHPAWPYLSSTHKADYLRCYLMHYYGGGYTDIKRTQTRWPGFFEALEHSDKFALGYTELPNGIPHLKNELGDRLRAAYAELIGLCAFIFKKETPLTTAWLTRTEGLLDAKLPLLREHPACHPLDQTDVLLPNGQPSPYPLRWAELLGEIFHPLIHEYRHTLIQAPIAPVFEGYR